MPDVRTYVLDANIFIQAKNSYYAFALCPGFWDCLVGHHESGRLCSIDHVKRELLLGNDDLEAWARHTMPDTFFRPTQGPDVIAVYQQIMTWVQGNSQFYDIAKADFAASADGWLVAYASVSGLVVVTHEQFRSDARNRVPLPNVCRQFGVNFADTFQMLKDVQVVFQWDRSPPPVTC